MHLLDVNVLIGRLDRSHPHHRLCFDWFEVHASDGWATCPITENGLLRILGQSTYPNGPGSPEKAAVALRGLRQAVPSHRFLPDDLSLLDSFTRLGIVSSKNLTDAYLLSLAVRHGAKFVTLDKRIDPAIVVGGPSALEVLLD